MKFYLRFVGGLMDGRSAEVELSNDEFVVTEVVRGTQLDYRYHTSPSDPFVMELYAIVKDGTETLRVGEGHRLN